MTKSLFRQSFLSDTLDVHTEFVAAESTLPNGTRLIHRELGVLEVIPAEISPETKHIIVSCGIHGDETAPMELIDSIINDIESVFQTVEARCLFICAHPRATLAHQRFLEDNLNRLFDDKPHPASMEMGIADKLKSLVDRFYYDTPIESRWHLDLHSAIRDSRHYTFAVSPKTRNPVRSKALYELIASSHIEALLLSNSPSSTFSWFSAERYSAQALTLELGRVARIGENDLDRFIAFDLALRNLIANEEAEHLSKPPATYRVSRSIVRLTEDFSFMFDDNVANFTEFVHGEVFGHDGDKPLMAKNDQEAIVFPNRHVGVGQRAALMVCPVKVRFDSDQFVYD